MKSKTYEEFVEKFKPKLTTDDCYTPPPPTSGSFLVESLQLWKIWIICPPRPNEANAGTAPPGRRVSNVDTKGGHYAEST